MFKFIGFLSLGLIVSVCVEVFMSRSGRPDISYFYAVGSFSFFALIAFFSVKKRNVEQELYALSNACSLMYYLLSAGFKTQKKTVFHVDKIFEEKYDITSFKDLRIIYAQVAMLKEHIERDINTYHPEAIVELVQSTRDVNILQRILDEGCKDGQR